MVAIQASPAIPIPRRQPQLDALRVFPMVGIFLHHLAPVTAGRFGELAGKLGVQLFFMLSGFLTTMVLLRDRQLAEATHQSPWKALRQFYIRRSLRLFPAYYLVIAVAIVVNLNSVQHILVWLLTHTVNLYLSWTGDVNVTGKFTHLWSLSVQEQFYVLWAIIMLFAPRRAILPVACALVAIGPLYRLYAVLHGVNAVATRFFTLSCLDSLGIGALLRLAMEFRSWKTIERLLKR